MKFKNFFLLGLSLMCGPGIYAASSVDDQSEAEIDMMSPSYILTKKNVIDAFESFSEETYQREFRFSFDLTNATPEDLKKFYHFSEDIKELRKDIDFDDLFDLKIFSRAVDYYDQKKVLLSRVHQALSDHFYSPYNVSRVNPEALVTSKKKLTLSFHITIGKPIFLSPVNKDQLSLENLQDIGLDDIKSYIKSYEHCLEKQAEGITDFIRKNKASIFVEDLDEPEVNGGIKALRFIGRFRRFFEQEQADWRKLFVAIDSVASETLMTKIALVRSEKDFEPFKGANVDVDCVVELEGVTETDFPSEDCSEKSADEESIFSSSSEEESDDDEKFYDVEENRQTPSEVGPRDSDVSSNGETVVL